MNQKIFLAIQGCMIYTKLKMKLTRKRSNRHNLLPDDEDSHCYHELIDMIDYRASSIPATQKDEPTHSVVELKNSYQAPVTLPSTAAINDETTLESEQQKVVLAQDSIIFKTPSVDTKQCFDNNAGIKTSECEECQETAMEHITTIPKESFIPDIHSHSRNLD